MTTSQKVKKMMDDLLKFRVAGLFVVVVLLVVGVKMGSEQSAYREGFKDGKSAGMVAAASGKAECAKLVEEWYCVEKLSEE